MPPSRVTKGEFNRTEIRGAAGMTLVEDKLYMRIAGIAKAMDGYVTRLDYACANGLPRPGTTGRPSNLRADLRVRAWHRRRPKLRVRPPWPALGGEREVLDRCRSQHRER